ncbi:glycoside hydrolase [Apiospora arundinis]
MQASFLGSALPHIRHSENGIQLIVKGEPFLMLAGELHNSSLSSAQFMSDVWPAMKAESINTLLGSVTWEMIEPTEGRFDFSELDAVIRGARQHSMRLVLLWFGTYKNGMSTYAPAWVKQDVRRFPRVYILKAGGAKQMLEMITPLSEEACKADAKAFAALMRHLKDFDAEDNTVLMVQVENETGLLGDSRDRSLRAEKAFRERVPKDLLKYLVANKKSLHPAFLQRFGHRLPTSKEAIESQDHAWATIFGAGLSADEAFMAHHISSYVGRVAAAGKAAYPIPLYANTWLNTDDPSKLEVPNAAIVVGGSTSPGAYPSGGPCPHVSDIWRHNAVGTTLGLDFLAPDLYFHDYEAVCRDYTAHTDNALFIPEQRRDEHGARRVWLALATYGALGVAPFGIDTGADIVGREYALLARSSRFLLSSRPAQRFGFFFDPPAEKGHPPRTGRREVWTRRFGREGEELEAIVERAFVFGKAGPGGGMVIQLGDTSSRRFLLVGQGYQVRFKSHAAGATFTGILNAAEKEVDEATGELRTLRVLNGDETRSGKFVIMPNDDPDHGGFPIAVTIPARTCIAEVEAYWICEDAGGI